ncbi:hypothetical protein CB0940_03862 [Cercospora beticola]|uniref:Uncharacterized protein n=1 Tax=Cercospora beticola TaxID=122368 RepID=A0A2G5HMC7_CERBT|nr:hypothetical protein CB0940_03862 [Cercospora beticola]PIA93701.1 hypothetical protein CB0940_03862 [Cercospora beticola]WPB01062.1 hypothetical protein RHO25_005682 [Cercospora beticola]
MVTLQERIAAAKAAEAEIALEKKKQAWADEEFEYFSNYFKDRHQRAEKLKELQTIAKSGEVLDLNTDDENEEADRIKEEAQAMHVHESDSAPETILTFNLGGHTEALSSAQAPCSMQGFGQRVRAPAGLTSAITPFSAAAIDQQTNTSEAQGQALISTNASSPMLPLSQQIHTSQTHVHVPTRSSSRPVWPIGRKESSSTPNAGSGMIRAAGPREQPPNPENMFTPFRPPFKDLPTIINDPYGTHGRDYIELRCGLCNANTGRGRTFMKGVHGLHTHIRSIHYAEVMRRMEKFPSAEEVVQMCAYRSLTREEVEQIRRDPLQIEVVVGPAADAEHPSRRSRNRSSKGSKGAESGRRDRSKREAQKKVAKTKNKKRQQHTTFKERHIVESESGDSADDAVRVTRPLLRSHGEKLVRRTSPPPKVVSDVAGLQ